MPPDLVLDAPSFGDFTPAEPGYGKSFSERLNETYVENSAQRVLTDAASEEGRDLARAALDATMYTKLLSSREQAYAEVAQRRIASIREATGVELENPYLGGYGQQARALLRERRFNPDYDPRGGLPEAAQEIFDNKIAEVRRMHGDKVADLGLDVPLEALANNLATGAEETLAIAQGRYQASKRSGGGALAAEAIGGAAGGSRDPLSIASWVAGPTGGVGRSIAMRVFNEGLTQGVFNLGLSAVEKPGAQAFREERGQPAGSRLLTAQEAGHALVAGFLGGAAVRGGIEGIGAAVRAAGARKLAADALAAEERPPGVSAQTHEAALDQAARHVNDHVNEPPPPIVPVAAQAGNEITELRSTPRDQAGQAGGGAGEATLPLRGGYIDTRGKGRQFHGAPSEVELSEGHYGGSTAFYGTQSLYTSDAMDVVHGYANKRGAQKPTIYEVAGPLDAKIYDMDTPIAGDLRAELVRMSNDPHGHVGELVEGALNEKPSSLREFFDEVRGIAQGERIPADDVQEGIFHPIQNFLEDSGFHGMTHKGGARTKTPEHKVVIYFSPEKNVQLSKLEGDALTALKAPPQTRATPRDQAGQAGGGKGLSADRPAELAALVRAAKDPIEAVEAIRANPTLGDAALASGERDLTDAAKLATLSDPAWAAVREGRSPPEHGLIAAEQAANPADHAPVLERLAKEAPHDAKEARVIAADEVEGLAARRDNEVLRQSIKPKRAVGHVPEERRSLTQFLAGRGGIAETPELRDMFAGTSSYIRPYGKLVREYTNLAMRKRVAAGGVYAEQLDRRAVEVHEAGYIAEPTERALLEAIDGELRGNKIYQGGRAPEVKLDPDHQAHLREQHREGLEQALDARLAELQIKPTKADRKRALDVMARAGAVSPLDAFERVLLENETRNAEKSRARQGEPIDIPFDTGAALHPGEGGGAFPPSGGDTGAVPGRPGYAGVGEPAGGAGPGAGDGGGRAGRRGVEGQLTLPAVGLDQPRARQGELPLAGGEADAAIAAQLRAQLEAPLAGGSKPPPKQGLFDPNTQHDMFDLVPTQREDGRPLLIEPAQVAAQGERKSLVSDMLRSCKD